MSECVSVTVVSQAAPAETAPAPSLPHVLQIEALREGLLPQQQGIARTCVDIMLHKFMTLSNAAVGSCHLNSTRSPVRPSSSPVYIRVVIDGKDNNVLLVELQQTCIL